MTTYLLVKTLHILSSTLLFGTGAGSAFFLFSVRNSKNITLLEKILELVVRADTIFTAPAVILQPLTGLILVHLMGLPMSPLGGPTWLLWAWGLFFIVGLCWLPAVWIQIRLRSLIRNETLNNHKARPKMFQNENSPAFAPAALDSELPQDLNLKVQTLMNIWIFLGVPAFVCMLLIFFLMVSKPT